MGQTLSIDTNPPKFSDFSLPPKCPKTNYTSNIKIWSINSNSIEPVKFSNFKTFSEKDCYIILHLFRKGNIPLAENSKSTPSKDSKNSLYELIHSSLEALTPRGLNFSFSINEFIKEEQFTLYLWNGKRSTPTSQSTAVSKALELEKLLDSVEKIFDCGEPEAIVKFYKDDYYEASTLYSPEAFENMCKSNALARFFQNKNSHRSSLPNLGTLLKEHIKIKKSTETKIENKENKPSSLEKPSSIKRFSSFSFISKQDRRKYSEDNISLSYKSPLLSPQPKSRRFSITDDTLIPNSPHKKVIEKNPNLIITKKLPSSSPREPFEEKSPRPNPSWGAAEMVVYYRKICSEIRPHFFLGSDYIARSKDILKKNNITHIVNAARVACDNYFPEDFSYLSLNLYDSPSQNIIGLFFPVIEFIDNALVEKKGGVYVHCYQGVSRSSAIVIAYIMWKEKKTFRVVNDEVKEKRQVTAPNAGFTVQLLRWEKIIFQKTKETYMYRLSPLNDRYQEHKQTGPQLCDVPKLDTRTCFIAYTSEGKIFIWIGKKSTENIINDATNFTKQLQKMVPGLSTQYTTIKEGEENPDFQDALSKIVTPEAIKKLINMNNPYPELDDFDKEPPKDITPSYKIEPIYEVKVKVEEDGKLYLFDGRTFENYSTFDSDDLDDGDIYVLISQKDKLIYVWIGSDVEDVNSKFVADEFIKQMNLPLEYEIHETTRDEEPEEFWKYFING